MGKFEDQINPQINVISRSFVKPKYEVEASKQPYYLGIVDYIFLHLDQIQKGLLFATKPKNIRDGFIETLKKSLAISLVHFYPLAGRLSTQEFPNENVKIVSVDCNKGSGALLIHATVDYTVSDILSSVDVHPIVRSFFDLGEKSINNDGHTRPLLSIQVTELIDGIFIGFTMNHSIVDGTTQWNFINSLSEIFLKLSKTQENDIDINIDTIPNTITQKPVFKPYFPDGYDPPLKFPIENPFGSKSPYDTKIVLRERIFHFSSKSISKLKAKANGECGVDNISSFQALSAFIWRSITRARNLEPEFDTCCGIIMNARPRFSPPLSSNYFGNFIVRTQPKCKVGDLKNKGLGWTATIIQQDIISFDGKKVRDFFEMIVKFVSGGPIDMSKGSPFYSPNLVVIGGSSRFPMYEADFGLGKAVAGLAGYCNKEDGKVTASPGREGGGSVDLELCLKPEVMSALELDEDFMSYVTSE